MGKFIGIIAAAAMMMVTVPAFAASSKSIVAPEVAALLKEIGKSDSNPLKYQGERYMYNGLIHKIDTIQMQDGETMGFVEIRVGREIMDSFGLPKLMCLFSINDAKTLEIGSVIDIDYSIAEVKDVVTGVSQLTGGPATTRVVYSYCSLPSDSHPSSRWE